MSHVTRTDTHLPPRMYTSDVTVSETGLHVEFAAGLHIATLHMSGTVGELLADLDTFEAALFEARRELEEQAKHAEYGVPAPRAAAPKAVA